MSRYTLADPGTFTEVLFGWDPGTLRFFMQCFGEPFDDLLADVSDGHEEDDHDEGQEDDEDEDEDRPAVWLSRLTLEQLVAELAAHGLTLPDLGRRVLLAESTGAPVQLSPGDPVVWRLANSERLGSGRVLEVKDAGALVEHPDGAVWLSMTELEPDLFAVGVE